MTRSLTLKPGRDKSVRNRHPWIFEGAIAQESGPKSPTADLFDSAGERLASGFYSERSQIRLRAWVFGDQTMTEALVRQRVQEAAERRVRFLPPETDAFRLIHSEGDDASGLVVDRYGDSLVLEITSAGLDAWKDVVVDALRQTTGVGHVAIRNDLPARKLEGLSLKDEVIGDPSSSRIISEHGLRFEVSPGLGQKTGLFLDQRENRHLFGSLCSGLDVLNLFSYSGGFGVYASKAGASSVEEVDISEPAIEQARRNHELNPSRATTEFTVANAFGFVRGAFKEGRQWDAVVCDPPAFARSRGEVEKAARGYKDMNLYAIRLVRPGGLLMTFSCSGHVGLDLFQKIVFSAAADAGRSARIVRRLGAGPDHPVSIYAPEGEYLKGLLLEIGQ
ncbi:MAG: class I SAM-dependent rRNA methyltransferase [Thermoanaerobaculia bacterium]